MIQELERQLDPSGVEATVPAAELPVPVSEFSEERINQSSVPQVSSIQPLNTHPAGKEIQRALNEDRVGRDSKIEGDVSDASIWNKWINYKKDNPGSELPL